MYKIRAVDWAVEYINGDFTREDYIEELSLKVVRICILLTDMVNDDII